jgi:hypothetical protein
LQVPFDDGKTCAHATAALKSFLTNCCYPSSDTILINSVFDRLKEFSGEEKRAECLMLELTGHGQTQPSEQWVECGGASALSCLQQWMRSPDAFCHAIRQDLDCNNDNLVSKMEFRRWSKDGVLVAAVKSISLAAASAPTPATDAALVAHVDQPTPATPPAAPVSTVPALAALESGCAPALPSRISEPVAHIDPPTSDSGHSCGAPALPPPNCPFSQWTAFKQGKSKLETDRIMHLKGPSFSDQCEERYQQWKSDVRMNRCSHIVGCDDATAEINFLTMEIQGQIIGRQSPNPFFC